MTRPAILVADDDPDILTAARLVLRRSFGPVEGVQDVAALLARLAERAWDAVLLDMNFRRGAQTGAEGLAALDAVRTADPSVAVVLMTAHGGVALAVESLKRGAADFVLKPWSNDKLAATLAIASALTRSRREADGLRARNAELTQDSARDGDVVGRSPALAAMWALVARAAPTEANILILGESGTGKEVFAREIHRRSAQANGPFVSVDLGAVPESLFESELFGHCRGAFTDAREDRIGRFQAAQGGTLFLDEVGNLTAAAQRKLLTALERSEVTPVGATKPVPVAVRLLAATNMPRAELGREAAFRQDLLYRINTVEIELPPLRERGDDVGLLGDHYAERYARKYKQPPRAFSPEASAALAAYAWPGNVRELRHAIERATILATGPRFEPADFPFAAARPSMASDPAGGFDLEAIERRVIAEALRANQGNISQTAAALGLTRPALYRRMNRHGL